MQSQQVNPHHPSVAGNAVGGQKVRRKRDFSQVIDPTTNQNVLGTSLTGGVASQSPHQSSTGYGNFNKHANSPLKKS